MAVEIRDAQAGDLDDWLVLWQGYLTFYKVTIPDHVTPATWARILDPMSPLVCRIAWLDGRMAGFAHHHAHLTTWDTRPTCYLEDLFVSPELRSAGIGRALIDDVIALGRETDCTSVYWITAGDNRTAQKLYDSYEPPDGTIRYSITL